MNKIREGYRCSSKGIIPNDWKVVNFKKCINISNGQVDPKEEPYCNMKHIGPGNIEKFTGKILYVNTAKEDMQTSGKYLFDKNDVLYGKINPQLGKVAYPQYEGICSADMYPMRADENYIKPLFLKYLLLSNDFFKYSVSVSMRTGMPKINREELNLYDFLLPTLQEQEKIASILSTVDEQIDNVDGLIEKNKELKKGLMQQLLTKGIGHTKFKKTEIGDIPEEWEVKKLKDLGSSIIGLTYSPDDLVGEGEGTLVLRSSNIKNSRIVFDDNKYVKANIQDKLIVKEDDILICSRNGSKDLIGKCALIDKKTEGCSFGAFMTIYRSHYNKYLFNVFTSYMFKRQIYNNLGATINQITTDNLNNFKVILPPIKEQEKIASILSKVDEKIDEYANKKQKLEELKKGLMQQLLTGRTRVI